MEQKQRFFIYDRREFVVLLFLALLIALFAFTLGVHLGKKVGVKGVVGEVKEAEQVETVDDKLPNRQQLREQTVQSQGTADENLNQALHDEVAGTGIKLDKPRQVVLPASPVSPDGGKTKVNLPGQKAGKDNLPAFGRKKPPGAFTIQIGSFPEIGQARQKVESLEALGMDPFLRSVDLEKKGQWFRVYLGGYPTPEEAEATGKKYVGQHVIDSFIVSKMPER